MTTDWNALRNPGEIRQASRALLSVGSAEFRRGVQALAETLVVPGDAWGLRNPDDVERGALALLVQDVDDEFRRGVLSLVLALDEHADPVQLADRARALRERLDTATGDVVDGVIINRDVLQLGDGGPDPERIGADPGRIPVAGDGWQDLDAGPVAGRHRRRRQVVVVFDEPGAVEL